MASKSTQSTEKPVGIIRSAESYEGCIASSDQSSLIGTIVRFPDGTKWMLTEALSNVKLQQTDPPFEATQVFVCVRLGDAANPCKDVQEAVVKVKYQIIGLRESLAEIEAMVEDREKTLNENPDSEEAIECAEWAQEQLYSATNPVQQANEQTINEVGALLQFRQKHSRHTPKLLNFVTDVVPSNVNGVVMVGGYIVFILMTKVPGKQISHNEFHNELTVLERNEIRQAFKKALIDVWTLGILPCDQALRNIVWDEKEKKCYVVDFENIDVGTFKDPTAIFDNDYWHFWGLCDASTGCRYHSYAEAEEFPCEIPTCETFTYKMVACVLFTCVMFSWGLFAWVMMSSRSTPE
ncbi:hypothetical protein B0J11DRAFT_422148 [Dendryphion nanum]|uniref:Uncharacterized protein n=1 Tax=Dendryphion nanum TaxID=256645 RepID=A0A9P9J1D4_9PLEO|nr:hypothetical protein B0J11DRAFT_422148 [Dendryphion nanum]